MKIKLVLIILLLLCGCFNKKTVKVGIMLAFSGKHVETSKNIRRGALLAVKSFADDYDHRNFNVEIITYDTKSEFDALPFLIKKLKQDKVHFVLGPLTGKMASFAIGATADEDILFISPTVASDDLRGEDDNFITIGGKASDQGMAIAREIQESGAIKVAIVYDSKHIDCINSIYHGIKNVLTNNNILLERQLDSLGNDEMNKFLQKIKKKKIEALVLITNGIDGGEFVQYLNKSKFKGQIYGPSWLKTKNYIKYGGRFTEGTKLFSSYTAKNKTTEFIFFKKEYLSMFNVVPEHISIYGYDAMKILLTSLYKSEDMNYLKVKKIIVETSLWKGLEEGIIIDKNGDTVREISSYIVNDGKYQQAD